MPSNRRMLGLRFALVVVIMATPPLILLSLHVTSDETRSKAEWGALQFVISNYAKRPAADGLIFQRFQHLHLVGIPAEDRASHVWLLLDPRAAPILKQMPGEKHWHLTPTQLGNILATGVVHEELKPELKRRLLAQ